MFDEPGNQAFGMTPFGWRCVCALFGILMVPVCYAFMRKISRNTWIASFAAALMVFDFMHFTLSRIGTRDVIVAFFIRCCPGIR
ncbi:phospholipid carrier-dependent glycosyltransferase [uncultured Clostridium sp.]|nr:phospholipid carrier-dependent glycosyltransferase [uncultured Clostridium sp.]